MHALGKFPPRVLLMKDVQVPAFTECHSGSWVVEKLWQIVGAHIFVIYHISFCRQKGNWQESSRFNSFLLPLWFIQNFIKIIKLNMRVAKTKIRSANLSFMPFMEISYKSSSSSSRRVAQSKIRSSNIEGSCEAPYRGGCSPNIHALALQWKNGILSHSFLDFAIL